MYKCDYTQHILLTNSSISTYVIKIIPHKDTSSPPNVCFYAGLKPSRQQRGGAIWICIFSLVYFSADSTLDL